MSKILCPICNQEVSSTPSKAWKLWPHGGESYRCENCKSNFTISKGKRAMGTSTIPKPK